MFALNTTAVVAADIQSPDMRKYAGQTVTVLEDCGRLFDTDQTWYLVRTDDGTEFHLQGKELVDTPVSLVKAPKATPTVLDTAKNFIQRYVTLPDEESATVLGL